MKVGIVGSGGFIGQALVKSFCLDGIEVIEFDSKNPITTNRGEITPRAMNLNALIWAAAKVNPISAQKNSSSVSQELEEWNQFLESWTKSEMINVPIFFLSSGGCVYTDKRTPFNEKSESTGINEYGRLKIKMERLLDINYVNAIILRLGNVYGGGQPIGRGQGVIAEWCNNIHNNNIVPVYGSLENFRDYIHIDDVVVAIKLLVTDAPIRGIYNLSSGLPSTLGNLISIFKEVVNEKIEFVYSNNRNTDRNGYYLSIDKLQSSIDWIPQVNLRDGIVRALNESRNAD
jgi:UDP-glucose 4-epimerase